MHSAFAFSIPAPARQIRPSIKGLSTVPKSSADKGVGVTTQKDVNAHTETFVARLFDVSLRRRIACREGNLQDTRINDSFERHLRRKSSSDGWDDLAYISSDVVPSSIPFGWLKCSRCTKNRPQGRPVQITKDYTMLTPNVTRLLLLLLLPFYATALNALELLKKQSDLTLITALVKRDPELVKLYSTVQNATVVAAVDSSFTSADPNNIIYSNRDSVRAILQDIVIRGLHPTREITTDPIYPSTYLSNPRLVFTSRGRAVAKLVEVAGQKTVDVGSGDRANITKGVR